MTITRNTIAALATAATVLGGLAVPSAAGATTPSDRSKGCVTYSEFKRAKTGMTVKQVARLFGTNGKQSSKTTGFGTTIEIRSYDGCTQFGVVSVLFTNGRLDTKSQAGL